MAINDEYSLRFDGFRGGQIAEDGRIMDMAEVTIIQNGSPVAQLSPRIDRFYNTTTGELILPMSISGAHSTIRNDVYVLLVPWKGNSAEVATFKVYINPLINLVWWGGLILIFGTLISAWPNETRPAHVRDRSTASPQIQPAGANA
jgi:cytochrome c-type biogenesis protein CcmF